MVKEFMSGNEAIARGAWEAGVHFAAGYPGTPSTEILENLARYEGIEAQWSANEKVAFDEGMGAAIGGLRVLVTMKHVGLNVAADAFMVFPYAGTNGGFVMISADDPGMHSSQNEQDNRYLARMAKVPLLEPSDPQECRDFVHEAYALSEQFNTPVMIRTTTRSAHTKGQVELGQRQEVPRRKYKRNAFQYSVPIYRHRRRPELEQKLADLRAFAETYALNKIELADDRSIGVITSGICYQYAKELLPDVSIFKLGLINPLPRQALIEFCRRHERVYVIEEGEAFIEDQLTGLGLDNVAGKALFGVIGEYSPQRVAEGLIADGLDLEQPAPAVAPGDELTMVVRPPMFCVGCGHRTVFDVLRQLKVHVAGDIGCYTMGALPPYEASHTTFSMGSSIGNAFGFRRAGQDKTVAIIGDSTFIHGGIPSLIDTVYNRGDTTVILLDNSTTGMTGGQTHPGVDYTLQGQPTRKLDFEKLVRAIGVEFVEVVDAWDRKTLAKTVRQAMNFEGPAVIIARGPCQLLPQMRSRELVPFSIDYNLCTNCAACYRTHCPAIVEGEKGLPAIIAADCVACTVCVEYCPEDAILQMKDGNGRVKAERYA
ncbi:MAG: thiamine pyrophosphate-dependent enzyme [Anaerolineae bacterium]